MATLPPGTSAAVVLLVCLFMPAACGIGDHHDLRGMRCLELCGDGLVCRDGYCRDVCGTTNACLPEQTCNGGACIPRPAEARPADGGTTGDSGSGCSSGSTRACYNGPPGTVGVGPCDWGRQACKGGAWGVCASQILPEREVCDGKDNDCDGKVDNLPELGSPCRDPSKVGACGRGRKECRGSNLICGQLPRSSAEVCDGLDNDCDGAVDERDKQGIAPCTIRIRSAINLNLAAAFKDSWGRAVPKELVVEGIVGSIDPRVPALDTGDGLQGSLRIVVEVGAVIAGAGGEGAPTSAVGGGRGGTALMVRVPVTVTSFGSILAGGGGGGAGGNGGQGGKGGAGGWLELSTNRRSCTTHHLSPGLGLGGMGTFRGSETPESQ